MNRSESALTIGVLSFILSRQCGESWLSVLWATHGLVWCIVSVVRAHQ